jgi:proline iminopeptidase
MEVRMKAFLWCAIAFVALDSSAPEFAAAHAGSNKPAAERESLSPGAHRFAVDGVNLWYRVAGQPFGEPVVFLHGGPGEGSQTFAHFAGPALERSLRMVYFDQRGSGRSDRPKDPKAYSIAQLVDDIEALRKHLAVSRIALIGHSFGTILGLEYVAKYPQQVSRVVLASAVPDLPRLLDIQCAKLQTEDAAAYARAVGARPAGSFPRCNAFDAYRRRPGGLRAAKHVS